MRLTFPLFLGWLWCQPWISIPMGSLLGLGLFPQSRVGVPLGSYLKGLTTGLGLVPQSVATSPPSSSGSLVSGL